MTVLRNRRIGGKAYLLGATSSGGNPGYTPLTDITFSQPEPTNSALNEGALNLKPVVATFAPVGGLAPYTFECLNTDATLDTNGYTVISYRSSILGLANDRSVGKSDMGWIVLPGSTGKAAARLLRVTDAAGTVVTKSVTIDTSLTAKRIWISANNRTVYQDQDPFNVSWYAQAWNGSAYDSPSVISVKSDPTGLFGINTAIGALGLNLVAQWPLAVGTYSIVLAASGYPDEMLTFQVKAGAVGPALFLPAIGVTANTAMPAYTPIGKLGYPSTLNAAQVIITDSSGACAYDLTTGNLVLRVPPSSATTLNVSVALRELDNNGNATYAATNTTTLQIPIAAGIALAPSAMALGGLTTAFTNGTYNNVLGTIPLPNGMDATKAVWRIVSQTGYTRRGEKNLYGASIPRYQIAAGSGGGGYLTAPAMLSAALDGSSSATDTVVVTVTDGLKVCTAPVSVTVSWAASTRTIYVGRGMASAHGSDGVETWQAFMNLFTTYAGINNPSAGHTGTWDVNVYTDTNPDWHVFQNANVGGDRFPIQGPIRVHGVPDGSGNLPRVGGVIANNIQTPNLSKGPVRFGDGDALVEMMEVSCVHGANQGDQRGGIYKDGNTYGNVTVRKCVVRDIANGMLGGHIHGAVLIDQTEFSHSGTETGGAGPAHGIYLDDASAVTITNSYFRLGNYGHLLKSRGTNQVIAYNRIIAGLGGSNSACVDLPDGGVCEVHHNDIEHGPNAEQNNVIQWGMEALSYSADSPYDVNSLYVHDNRINGMLMAGQHYGGPSDMLKHARFLNRFGEPVQSVRFENNACWFGPRPGATASPGIIVTTDPYAAGFGQFIITIQQWTTVGPTVSLTGNTIPTLPFVTSTARPYLSGNMPALGGLAYHFSYNDSYSNFDTVWQYGDRDQISVSASAGQGVALAVLHATNDVMAQGAGTANPFGAGTTWSIITDPVFYPSNNPNPWAASGKYQITTASDGSATLQTGATARTSGVDYVQVRATAPNGTKSDIRYAVTVTL